jgi:hypothetical protein
MTMASRESSQKPRAKMPGRPVDARMAVTRPHTGRMRQPLCGTWTCHNPGPP